MRLDVSVEAFEQLALSLGIPLAQQLRQPVLTQHLPLLVQRLSDAVGIAEEKVAGLEGDGGGVVCRVGHDAQGRAVDFEWCDGPGGGAAMHGNGMAGIGVPDLGVRDVQHAVEGCGEAFVDTNRLSSRFMPVMNASGDSATPAKLWEMVLRHMV